MKSTDLAAFGAPPAMVEVWSRAVDELTEVQEKAVRTGVLDGVTNLLVVAPTSSGKTLIGEMAATSSAYRTRKHSLFLVPFRALADEHYWQFRERYADLLNVVISTSDWDQFDEDIRSGNFGLAVLTYEKLTGLLVDHPQLLDRCACLVIDEIQMLGDTARGPALELLLTQVVMRTPRPQTIALSASLDELNQLDDWLQARLAMSNERPVPLEEGVLAPGTGKLLMADGSSLPFVAPCADEEEAIRAAVAAVVEEGKQVLVFRSSINRVRTTAELLKQDLPAPGLGTQTAALLDELEETENVEVLRKTLASGIGFHSANLLAAERRAVEASFRSGETRVLVATSTLAMGVNLPTDVVILGDHKRWIPERGGWRFEDYSVAEYKNEAGRAGRLGLRTKGLAILVAERDGEQRQLGDYYCRGQVEPVSSKLSTERLSDIVFDVLSAGLAHDEGGIADFISNTFAYLTFYDSHGGMEAVRQAVRPAVALCETAGLVVGREGKLVATPLGVALARRSIPVSGAVALSALANRLVIGPLPVAEVIYCVAAVDDVYESRPFVKWHKLLGLEDPRRGWTTEEWHTEPAMELGKLLHAVTVTEKQARIFLRTACLLDWIGGTDNQRIASRYSGCPTSRVRDMGRTTSWLLDGLEAALRLLDAPEERLVSVHRLAQETRYGLPAELAPLAQMDVPGVGRSSLLALYRGDNGRTLYDPDTLLEAPDEEYVGLLRPIELARLRAAIIDQRGESLKRRMSGHLSRAELLAIDSAIIRGLYVAEGSALEQAVADALASVGLSVTRVTNQKMGEEDLRVAHPRGVIVVSVTASDDRSTMIKWNKVKAVLGAGVGLNPINYACVGRPGFHSLAVRLANEMAQETGPRRLLLLPVDVVAEMVLRCREGSMTSDDVRSLLADHRGLMAISHLPTVATDLEG